MMTIVVIRSFDLFEDRHACLGLDSEPPSVNEIALRRGEEALGQVVPVAHRAYGWPNARLAAVRPAYLRTE